MLPGCSWLMLPSGAMCSGPAGGAPRGPHPPPALPGVPGSKEPAAAAPVCFQCGWASVQVGLGDDALYKYVL